MCVACVVVKWCGLCDVWCVQWVCGVCVCHDVYLLCPVCMVNVWCGRCVLFCVCGVACVVCCMCCV